MEAKCFFYLFFLEIHFIYYNIKVKIIDILSVFPI